jgi:hypothetical protein
MGTHLMTQLIPLQQKGLNVEVHIAEQGTKAAYVRNEE